MSEPSSILQFPDFGGLIAECTNSIRYSCKKVRAVGWLFGPDTCLRIQKNFYQK